MILGVDFDNTIACYDGLFHALALERGLIPADLPTDKTAVRDFLRDAGKEDDWTELQGLGYGPDITRARPFDGVTDTMRWLRDRGVETHVVSHKTKTPYRGEPHDLHAAARRFLDHHGLSPTVVPAERVHLELTKDAKLQRIAALGCTHFIDDLPEFLGEPAFPDGVTRWLFDPANRYRDETRFDRFASWSQIAEALRGTLTT